MARNRISTASAVQRANGALSLKWDPAGRWTSATAAEFAAAIIETGLPVSGWSLWVDGFPKGKTPKVGELVSSEAFAALVADAESILLVHCTGKREDGARFPVCKMKLNKGKAHAAYLAFNATRKAAPEAAPAAPKRVKI